MINGYKSAESNDNLSHEQALMASAKTVFEYLGDGKLFYNAGYYEKSLEAYEQSIIPQPKHVRLAVVFRYD